MFGIRQLQETLECDLDINTEQLASYGPGGIPKAAASQARGGGSCESEAPARVKRPSGGEGHSRGPQLTPAVFGDPSAPTTAAAALFVLLTEPVTCHSCHYTCVEPSICCPAGMNQPQGQQRVRWRTAWGAGLREFV